jgi:hypothetical protein
MISRMTADEWIAAFAAALNEPLPSDAELGELLKLASVAAHASERRAAPIACFLAARAGVEPERARLVAETI